MSRRAAAVCDDPWGEHAYAAQLAQRPKDPVQDHLLALHAGSRLTRWFREKREPEVLQVSVENVIAALNRAGIRPVLLGTHGIGGYRSEPRATEDVDVLVRKREVGKAVRVLEQEFPYLEIVDTPVVTRFRNAATQKIVLDVMKPASQGTSTLFRHTVAVGKTHRIPTLEMALVSKFVAIVSPTRRQAKKLVDLGDFVDMVEHNRAILDLKKLRRLADRVQPGSGAMIQRLLADIDAGRTINLKKLSLDP